MLGERAAQAAEIEVEPRERGAAVIELDDVTVRSADGRLPLDGVSLEVHEGEITGIAAVAGNGQAELANAILGVAELEGGAIRLGGRDYTHASTADRLQEGLVAVIPEGPLEPGAVPSMSVGDNLLLTTRRIPARDGSSCGRSACVRRRRRWQRPRRSRCPRRSANSPACRAETCSAC